jgi:hypothetical protein
MNLKRLFGHLHELPGSHPDDPVHSESDLWFGIDMATAHLGFTLEDVALLFRRNRPCAIAMFARLGGMLVDRRPRPGEFWAMLRDPAKNAQFNAVWAIFAAGCSK